MKAGSLQLPLSSLGPEGTWVRVDALTGELNSVGLLPHMKW